MLEQAKIDKFRISDDMRAIAREKFAVVGGTKIVEDSFQRGRQEEREGGNANLEMRPARFYDKLLRSGLASELHKYKEVPWQSAVVPRGSKDLPTKGYFEPQARATSQELRSIMSTAVTPSWYSPAPVNQCQQDADILLARHLQQIGRLDRADSSWLCTLFRGQRLLVRCRSPGQSDDWAFAIGHVAGSVALVWPAAAVRIGKALCYTMATAAKPDDTIRFLYDVGEWDAMEYEWYGFSGAHCLARSLEVPPGAGCMALPLGEARPLLQVCARQAFSDLPNIALGQLTKHIGAPFSAKDSLFERLQKVLAFVLPSASEEELMEIMKKRIQLPSLLEAYLTSGAADDIMVEDDRQELHKQQKSGPLGDRGSESQQFAKAYVAKARDIAATKARPKKRAKTASAEPKRIELSDSTTAKAVNAVMPPMHRIWHDHYNSRWQLFQGTKRIRSFSFNLYGIRGASRAALEVARAAHEATTGEAWQVEVTEAS